MGGKSSNPLIQWSSGTKFIDANVFQDSSEAPSWQDIVDGAPRLLDSVIKDFSHSKHIKVGHVQWCQLCSFFCLKIYLFPITKLFKIIQHRPYKCLYCGNTVFHGAAKLMSPSCKVKLFIRCLQSYPSLQFFQDLCKSIDVCMQHSLFRTTISLLYLLFLSFYFRKEDKWSIKDWKKCRKELSNV